MTAFDNIKTNNWPATSNDFEDFLVLKMPLNDNASLTESLPVVVGNHELSAKRTLTNTGVSIEQPQSVVNVKLHTYIYNTPGTLTVNGNTIPRGSDPNGDVTFTVAVNGGLSSIAWSYDSGNGPYCYMRGIEVDLGDGNGYQLIQDGAFGVSAYSSLISGTADSSYPLSNLFGGTIGTGYTNGTRHTNPGTLTLNLSSVFPPKKYYDNNADFSSGRLDLENSLFTEDNSLTFGSGDFTIEAWVNISDTTASNPIFCGQADGTTTPGSAYIFTADTTNSRTTRIHVGSTVYSMTWGADFTANQWYHLAFVRDGSRIRIYRDGVQANNTSVGSSSSHNTGSTTHKPSVGSMVFAGTRYNFQGKIQDLRVYKGLCKYPGGTSFTPPVAILN